MPPEVQPSAAELITLRGEVQDVFYSGPGFSAGRMRTDTGERVPFAGKLFVRQGDTITMRGRWGTHPKYGRQFEVDGVEYEHPIDTEGLAKYLAANPALKGIGPAKARAIAEAFGRDFDRVIMETPEQVARVAHLRRDVIDTLRDEWLRSRNLNALATWLAAFGLTHFQVTMLLKKLGNDARAILESDPYVLVREVRGFGFKRVDKIARTMGTPKDHPGRIRAGIVACIDEALDQGHTWCESEDLVSQANILLVMDTLDSRDRIERALDALVEENVLSCVSTGDRFLIAKPAIQRMEEDLAGIFRSGDQPNPHFLHSEDSEALIAGSAAQLNERQRAAVLSALRNRITLISGGAGSGKTFTVAALTNILEDRGLLVELAAPTGKAAKRIEELVGRRASTLHRLLKFDGHRWGLDAEHPIDADVVIVDEVSMVDVPLAHRFFKAVDLAKTAVVLVGDHNQLPPVGPGNILRDLIKTGAIPTVILDQIVRQAGVLKENSAAVLGGRVARTSDVESSGLRAWYVCDQFSDQGTAFRFVVDLFENVLQGKLGFDLLGDVQLLTPTHKGPLGTIELNIALQRLLQKKLHGIDVPLVPAGRRARVLLHDKVIQTRNNYELEVMNGAMGTVKEVHSNGSLTVEFDSGMVDVRAESIRDLELAYALTIHKTQGSEFLCVVALIHKAHAFQHHRNLLYTAVTRARQTVILVGDSWGMKNCAAKRQVDGRRTFLPFLLLVPVSPSGQSVYRP